MRLFRGRSYCYQYPGKVNGVHLGKENFLHHIPHCFPFSFPHKKKKLTYRDDAIKQVIVEILEYTGKYREENKNNL